MNKEREQHPKKRELLPLSIVGSRNHSDFELGVESSEAFILLHKGGKRYGLLPEAFAFILCMGEAFILCMWGFWLFFELFRNWYGEGTKGRKKRDGKRNKKRQKGE